MRPVEIQIEAHDLKSIKHYVNDMIEAGIFGWMLSVIGDTLMGPFKTIITFDKRCRWMEKLLYKKHRTPYFDKSIKECAHVWQ